MADGLYLFKYHRDQLVADPPPRKLVFVETELEEVMHAITHGPLGGPAPIALTELVVIDGRPDIRQWPSLGPPPRVFIPTLVTLKIAAYWWDICLFFDLFDCRNLTTLEITAYGTYEEDQREAFLNILKDIRSECEFLENWRLVEEPRSPDRQPFEQMLSRTLPLALVPYLEYV